MKTAYLDVNNPPDDIDILEVGSHHGHLPDVQAVEKWKVVNEIKDNIAANPSAPIKRVYDETVSGIQRQAQQTDPEEIPIFEDISQVLKRKKTQNVPLIPESVADRGSLGRNMRW